MLFTCFLLFIKLSKTNPIFLASTVGTIRSLPIVMKGTLILHSEDFEPKSKTSVLLSLRQRKFLAIHERTVAVTFSRWDIVAEHDLMSKERYIWLSSA